MAFLVANDLKAIVFRVGLVLLGVWGMVKGYNYSSCDFQLSNCYKLLIDYRLTCDIQIIKLDLPDIST